MSVTIRIRRDSAANWTSANPILALGEMGFETDTRKHKFGDGATAWAGLSYAIPPSDLTNVTGQLATVNGGTGLGSGGLVGGNALLYEDSGSTFAETNQGVEFDLLYCGASGPSWEPGIEALGAMFGALAANRGQIPFFDEVNTRFLLSPKVTPTAGDLLTWSATSGGRPEWTASAGGGPAFADNVFRVQDNADATKQIAFEASGITTGTTRTLTVPDADGTIALSSLSVLRSGTQALTANWDAGSYQIRAETFQSDVTTGTAPLTVASTTLVTNLNADLLDGQTGSYYTSAANITGQLPVAQGGTGSATASAARTALGVAIGSDVQAYDATLSAVAGLSTGADKVPYFTGTDTASTTTLTSFARTLLDDADAATARTTLGLVIGTNVQAYDADLATVAGLGSALQELRVNAGGTALEYFTPTSGGTTFADDVFAIQDDADATKQLAFQLSGVTTGTTRTLTVPDASGTIALTSDATDLSNVTGGPLPVADGGTGSASASAARTALGLAIGSDVQAYSARLGEIAALAVTDGNFAVANGTGWVAENGATARTSLGLGSIATQAASAVAITGGSVAGITDLAVADGGTGSSTAAGARTNLGLVIGTDVQAQDAELSALAGLTSAADSAPYFTGSGTAALATLTAFARTLLDDADAATARATLDLEPGTDVQAYSADLATVAGLGSALQVLRTNAGGTAVEWAAAASGGDEFADNVFRVQDNTDATKELAFELSSVTTGTTRTLTVPDGSGTVALASGLSGGQTIYGGTATGDRLYLVGNSSDVESSANNRIQAQSMIQAERRIMFVEGAAISLTSDGSYLAAYSGTGSTESQLISADSLLHGAGLTTASRALVVDAAALERGGSAEIDGDHLDIDFTPSNYTPSTAPAEAANVDDLAAHLAGIDDALGSAVTGTVAVAEGGTGATTASGARTNLGLVIGTNVQAYDADLGTLAGLGTALQIPRTNAGATAIEWADPPSGTVIASTNDGRISLHASDSLGGASAAGTLYYHRHAGDTVALYDGSSAWSYLTIAATPVSIALSGGTASKPHDVWAYDSSGTVALELTAWTDDTTRATALVMQDGVWVKTGATTRRYLGTVYLDGSKQATDAAAQRDVWNEAHPVAYGDYAHDSTDSWTYPSGSSGVWAGANSGAAAWKHTFTIGRARTLVEATAAITAYNQFVWSIGRDSTTAPSAYATREIFTNTSFVTPGAVYYAETVPVGRHYVQALNSTFSITSTAFGDAGDFYLRAALITKGER